MIRSLAQKTEILAASRFGLYSLISLLALTALSYAYFANSAVRTVTSLEKTRDEMQVTSVKVSELESKKLAMENQVSPGLAAELGFVEAANPIFIMKGPAKAALSLKTR